MSTHDLTADAVECQGCGYDLRAQPSDSKCPECGLSVIESQQLATIPRRPAWRDSDPRWRRRILLGAWVLVLIPLMALVGTREWASNLVVPTPLPLKGPLMLDETFAWNFRMYEYVTFCIGVVLLFSKERNRRPGRFDWTRRWGVTTSYGVFLLYIPQFAMITALVLAGIACLFLGMPAQQQPAVTQLLIKVCTVYLAYGPGPNTLSVAALPVFSSVAVMLACAPLYNALRSCGRETLALLLLAPLFMASLLQIANIALYILGPASPPAIETNHYTFYFNAPLLVTGCSDPSLRFVIEAAKWSACLAIAIKLSFAQIKSWQRPQTNPSAKASHRRDPPG